MPSPTTTSGETPEAGSDTRLKNLFRVPAPVLEAMSEPFLPPGSAMSDYWPILFKILEWSCLFLVGCLGLSYAWVVCLGLVYYSLKSDRLLAREVTHFSEECFGKHEKEVLTSRMSSLPSWVTFPDVDRVEWINTILRKVWPHIGETVRIVARELVQPKVQEILNRLNLEAVSNFRLLDVSVGTVPARLGGVKVYETNTGRDEIVMDVDLVYCGDARVRFALRGLDCEINQVTFRGTARLIVKPLMNVMPIVGGFELYFMQMPQLEYNLAGLANFADIPGFSNIVKNTLHRVIGTRLVWPNRISFYFPIESVRQVQDQSFCMPAPQGVLTVTVLGARNLVKMDKMLFKGKSDPYCILKVGQQKISFVDSYISSTLDPVWNYEADFAIEESSGMELNLEVFDYDKGSEDDFMGCATVPINDLIKSGTEERWVTLDNVKHGDVLVKGEWRPAVPASSSPTEVTQISGYVVSVFIDSCTGIKTQAGKEPLAKCEVKVGSGQGFSPGKKSGESGLSDVYTTVPRGPSHNPMFREGHFFLSKHHNFDTVGVRVVDDQGGAVLGSMAMKVSYLLNLPDRQFLRMEWDLDGVEGAKIVLSAKLFQY